MKKIRIWLKLQISAYFESISFVCHLAKLNSGNSLKGKNWSYILEFTFSKVWYLLYKISDEFRKNIKILCSIWSYRATYSGWDFFTQETLKLLPRIRPMYGFSRLYDWHFNNDGTYLGAYRVPSSQTRSYRRTGFNFLWSQTIESFKHFASSMSLSHCDIMHIIPLNEILNLSDNHNENNDAVLAREGD